MRRSGPQIISALRENIQLEIGRHLYGVLGSYASLKRFEQLDLNPARFLNGKPFPNPVNLNRSLLDRIGDEDLRSLVQNEARLPQTVQRRLNQEFDLLLQSLLQQSSFLILKQIEFLFAYNLDLHVIRAGRPIKAISYCCCPVKSAGTILRYSAKSVLAFIARCPLN